MGEDGVQADVQLIGDLFIRDAFLRSVEVRLPHGWIGPCCFSVVVLLELSLVNNCCNCSIMVSWEERNVIRFVDESAPCSSVLSMRRAVLFLLGEEEICVEHKGIRIGEIVIVGVASCGGKHLEIWKIANLYRGEVVGQQALQPNTS